MSQLSQYRDALLSVRIVVMDHYMASPVPNLDPVVSDFRGYSIRKVPILRIFGPTPTGQKCCLHLHGIFPYMYVPMPEREDEGFVYRLASSLDKAINISMQQGKSNVQHVYKAVKVRGRPMYGYHPRQHNFIKIFFYNPYMVKRSAELLAAGAVMNRVLQPHESHINLELQFMMDYNLQGMNQIHLRHALFRQGELTDEFDNVEPFFSRSKVPPGSPGDMFTDSPEDNLDILDPLGDLINIPSDRRFFRVVKMPVELKLPVDITRQSTTELEMDAVAVDVLNTNDLGDGGGMNPGLTALWDDERERRRLLDIEDPLTPPDSPPRPVKADDSSESELFWYEKYRQVVREKKSLSGRSSPPQESQDPDATINMFPTSHPRVYPTETSDRELDLLPEATQLEPHVSSLSQTVMNLSLSNQSAYLDITIPDLDQTVVDEEVIASQMSGNQTRISGSQEELVDILADLADEAFSDDESDNDMFSDLSQSRVLSDLSQSISPVSKDKQMGEKSKAPIPSQSSVDSNSITGDTAAPSDDFDDDVETLEMTQVVWDTDPISGNSEADEWADLDNTLMEDLAKGLDDSNSDINDIEDMCNSQKYKF